MTKEIAHTSVWLDTPIPPSTDRNTLSHALRLLRDYIHTGICETPPETLTANADFTEIISLIAQTQRHLVFLARGEISKPVPFNGYTGSILKELQANLHQLAWKARRMTAGDYTCSAGCMGELSEAFEVMGASLQSALARLEQQKKDLTELSESLRQEIEARIAVEDNLRREQIRLQKLASTDPLTGIANRRHFFQLAVRETERIRRTGSPACLAMLDIDHFKALNDTMGHAFGDKILRRIAKLISGVIRPYDLVGRYGGDEFIFLFPETSREMAHSILERLRDSVEKAQISAGERTPLITVSIGLTEITPDKDGSAALDKGIARADEALYQAKAKSRNHISVV